MKLSSLIGKNYTINGFLVLDNITEIDTICNAKKVAITNTPMSIIINFLPECEKLILLDTNVSKIACPRLTYWKLNDKVGKMYKYLR